MNAVNKSPNLPGDDSPDAALRRQRRLRKYIFMRMMFMSLRSIPSFLLVVGGQ